MGLFGSSVPSKKQSRDPEDILMHSSNDRLLPNTIVAMLEANFYGNDVKKEPAHL
jgi:hypothetical protein